MSLRTWIRKWFSSPRASKQNKRRAAARLDRPRLEMLEDRLAPAVVGYSVRSDVNGFLYSIDLGTGTATQIGSTNLGDVEGLTFDNSTGTLYGVDDATDELITIDTTTGTKTVIGSLGATGADNPGLSFDGSGNLYASGGSPGGRLIQINLATGAATAIGNHPQAVTGLAFGSGVMYGLGGQGTNNLVTINLATGAATSVGSLGIVVNGEGGIDFAPNGTLYGLEDQGAIFTINPATGAASTVATTLMGFEGLAIFVPSATLSATLSGGNLAITDVSTTGINNSFTVNVSGGNLVITDAIAAFASAPAGGTLSNNNQTLTIPLASVSTLTINGAAGNDTATVDSTNGLITVPIQYDGGGGFDRLNLTQTGGATRTSSRINVGANPGDGQSVITGGGNTQTVGFQNIEPITDNVAAATFTLSSVAGIASLLDANNAINYVTGQLLPTGGRITVDNFEPVEFENKTSLVISAGAGDDVINLRNPNTPTGLTSITVNGNDPTASDVVIVNGTAAADTVAISNLTIDGAQVTGLGPTINVTTAEQLHYSGQGGSDSLTLTTPAGSHILTLTPGATAGEGSIASRETVAVGGAPLLDITFSGINATGALSFADVSGTRVDQLTVEGTTGSNVFNVISATGRVTLSTLAGGGTVSVTLPNISTPGVAFLELLGLDGDDEFTVGGSHPFVGGILVDGGNPTASDTLTFTGAGGNLRVNTGAQTIQEGILNLVRYAGIEHVRLNAVTTGGVRIDGLLDEDDAFTVRPNDATGAIVSIAGNSTIFEADNVDPADGVTVDGNDGLGRFNSLTVLATEGNDAGIGVSGTAVSVPGRLPVNLIDIQALRVEGLGGDDTFNVTASNDVAITIDGGEPTASDTLNLTTGTNASVAVNYGTDPSSGVVTDNVNGNVAFVNTELINLTGTGAATSLAVNGTNGNDAITQSNGTVTVNNGAAVTFTAYQTLTLNGNNGDDVISVSNAAAAAGLTSIVVSGGAPTASDTLIVNGTAATVTIDLAAGTITGAGATPITFGTVEAITVNMGASTTLAVTGSSSYIVNPGAANNTGSVQTGTIPISFVGLDSGETLSLTGVGGADSVVANGTAAGETFTVAAAGTVAITNRATIATTGIETLRLNGLSGDDTFVVNGTLPFTTTFIDGGDPSGDDLLRLTNPAGAVTVLIRGSVTGGNGNMFFFGLEILEVDANTQNVTVNATIGDDAVSVTPTGTDAATIRLTASSPSLGSTPVVNASNIGTLSVDLIALGSDSLTVNATQGADNIAVTGSAVSIAGLETVNYTNAESVIVNGLAGRDTFNVTPSGVNVFIDGGDPIGVTTPNGDTLNIVAGGAAVIFSAGPETDEGSLIVGANAAVSFDHIENVGITGAASTTVTGTNAADAITVIARNAANGPATADGNQDFTVSVNDGIEVYFENVPTLTINALGGSDEIALSAGVALGTDWNVSVTVDGGQPTGSDTVIFGTPGTDTVSFQATAADAGTFTMDGDTIILTQIEHLIYDGEAGTDSFSVVGTAGNDSIVHTPGSGNDEGTVRVNSLLAVTYQNLGAGALGITGGAGGTDSLTALGTGVNDSFSVAATTGVVSLNSQLAITPTSLENLILEGLSGDDTFNLAGPIAYTSVALNGGDPTASDVVNLSNATGIVLVDLGARTVTGYGGTVNLTGVETLNLDAGGNNIVVVGSAGADSLSVTPTGTNTATFAVPSLNLTINTNNTAALGVDGVGGSDLVTVNGSNSADTITAAGGAGLATVQVGALKTVSIVVATTEALVIAAGAGADSLVVNSSVSPILTPIAYDGGTGVDSLTLTGGNAISDTYTPGPTPGTGRSVIVFPGGTQTVTFSGLEPVIDNVASSLVVVADNANNAISYTQGGAVTTGLVAIDNQETIEFSNKTSLTILALGGDDVISLNNANTPTGLTGITVLGGDPTASDTLIVNGTAATTTVALAAGSITGAGPVPITFVAIEAITVNVGTSTTLAVTGSSSYIVNPGAANNTGSVQTGTIPISFVGLDAGAETLSLTGVGAADSVTVNGTSAADAFTVSSGTGNVTIVGRATIVPTGIEALRLNGLDGDDVFVVAGTLPFTSTGIDGGDPSASDVLNLNTPAGAVAVNLGAGTVTGYGGTISLIGVEVLNADANTQDVTVIATGGNDAISVTPTGANAATIQLTSSAPSVGSTPVVNASSIGALSVSLLAGSDSLTVNATQGADTIAVSGTAVAVTGLETVNYTAAENLIVNGLAGSDTFNVTPSAVNVFIDGGDPIGTKPGDVLAIAGGGGAVQVTPGPEKDEGGVVVAGGANPGSVSFDHIETVVVVNANPALILGTNGDDDITIIARDASTHAGANGVQDFTVTVNDVLDILFIDTASLFVDGLAGDDDIVLRTPAPNGADWDVDVTIAGGPPSAATGAQGDVFEMETPGTTTVVFTPTGSDTGTILLDQGANDSTIALVNTFTIAALTYTSSPGGVEDFVYDGEGGNDSFTVVGTAGNDAIVHTPGVGNDEGRIRVNTLLGVSYQNLGAGTLRIADLGGTDSLTAEGTVNNDTFSVAAATGVVTLNSRIAITPTSIENLRLQGLAGDDTFNIPGNHTYTSVALEGGTPDVGSDVLNFTGTGANAITVDVGAATVQEATQGAVSISGIETVNANATNASATFTATGGDDSVDVTPTGADAVRIQANGVSPVVNFSGVGATMTVFGAAGNDGLVFNGSAANDTINLSRAAGTDSLEVVGRQLITPAAFDAWTVNAGEGSDAITVTDTAATSIIPITINAGPGTSDTLTNAQAQTTTYRPGTSNDAGSLVAGPLSIEFTGIDAVTVSYDVSTTGTIDAGAGANQISVTGTGATTLVSTVDNHSPVTFTGATLTTFNVLAGAGDDVIAVTPGTFTGAGGINVTGGDPTASDKLVITGTAVANAVVFTPTSSGSGSLTGLASTVTFTTTEQVVYNSGDAGLDTITINGTAVDDTITVNPTNGGSGNLVSNGSPAFSFTGAPTVTATGGAGGFDVLAVVGTEGVDTVTSAADVITVTTVASVGTVTVGANLDRIDVSTLGGNDSVTLTGVTLPTIIRGGDGDDTLIGSPQVDTIFAGTGNDILIGGASADFEYGEDGNDRFGDLTLTGNGVADDAGADFMFGGDGIDQFIWEPGDGSDIIQGGVDGADILRFFGADAVADTFNLLPAPAAPTHFNVILGAATVDTHGVEQIIVTGRTGGDTFNVADLTPTEVASLVLDATAGDTDAVNVSGRAADDNLLISTPGAGAINVLGLEYTIGIVNVSTADRLTVSGQEGDDRIVANAGIEANILLSLNGNDGNDYLQGAGGNDILDGGQGDDTFFGGGGTDNVGGGVGSSVGDTILLPGTSGNDTFSLSLSATAQLVATINGLTTTYNNFAGGPIATSGVELIQTNGQAGLDSLTVDSTNGAVPIPINFDGGASADLLTLTGGTATSDVYTPGPNPGQGTSVIVIGGVTQLVSFENLEPVIDLVAGPLVVNADNAINAINYSVGSVATRGLVSIDTQETIEFSNKTTLTINALSGDDVIHLNNPNTPTGLTGITVNGGDPTASDTLIINGTAATTTIALATSTITGAGPVTITYGTIEAITANVGASTTLAVSGSNSYIVNPGAANNTGSVQTGTIPISFIGLDAGETLSLTGVGGADSVVVNGTLAADAFTVAGGTGNVTIAGRATVAPTGIETMRLNGLSGDDSFAVAGTLPFTSTIIDAGDPSTNDVVSLSAPAGAVTVDLAARTVTGYGGTVSLIGVEVLNADANTQNVLVNATAGTDVLTVQPTGTNAATAALTSSTPSIGNTPVVNAANIGTLTVDLLGAVGLGGDQLVVVGTQGVDAITVTGALVTVNPTVGGPFETVNYLNTEDLRVIAQAGDDTITVTPSADTTIFVDGGDPIGSTPGDVIVYLPPGAFVSEPGPENDEGGLVGAGVERVSFDHIEALVFMGPGPAKVIGTGADDDITIIARDASTHPLLAAFTPGIRDFTVTVNDGPEQLFIDQAQLFVDAFAGDDDIVLRTPAPNNQVWDVDVFIAGGTPAAPTGIGQQGDVFELETPGTQTVVYTPTGIDTATLDVVTLSSLITIAPFICPVSGLPTSPGGVEQIVYQGLGGGDTLTMNGTAVDDTFTVAPANGGSGTHRSDLAPLFDFFGATAVTATGGTGGFDVLSVVGTEGADTITSAANVITVTAVGSAGTATAGANLDRIDVSGLGGNDSITLTGVTLPTIIRGGDGDDTLIGSPQVDTIFAGSGNDILIGGAGADFEYGEDGNDRFGDLVLTGNGVADDAGADFMFGGDGIDQFIWEPGDGSDIIQGGVDSSDILRFFGSDAVADTFTLTPAAGAPTHFNVILGAATVDTHGVEQIIVTGRTGGDTFNVADLTPTEVVHVDLDATPGDVDAINAVGRAADDNVLISTPGAGTVNIFGLEYDIRLLNVTAADRLTFSGAEGDDKIKANAGVEAVIAITLNGNDGDDFLSADAIINGGMGDDFIEGGAGDDMLFGNEGEDTFLPGGGNDTIDGGPDFDTILIRGTSGNDVISVNQTSATNLQYVVNGNTQNDTLVTVAGVRTVEATRVEAGSGTDIINATWADSLGTDGVVNSLRIDVRGGEDFTTDRLGVVDSGTGDLVLYRKGELDSTGTVTIGPGNAEPLQLTFREIEILQPVAAAGGQIEVFKHDPFEFNDFQLISTHLGAAATINLDPTIDPGADGNFGLPADQDFYRVEAKVTGTLDFQVFFNRIATVPSGRPGLPGNGDLRVQVLDAAGNIIGGAGTFGTFDTTTANERVRIPVVQGQLYFLQILGATPDAINNYGVTIINEAPPKPFDLELDDLVPTAPVTAGLSTTSFTSTAANLSLVNGFYVGKFVEITAPGSPLLGQRALITGYTVVGITKTFTLGTALTAVPAAGTLFQVESNDTGRSQLDNYTRDNTPRIIFRLDDAIFLNDLPGNDTTDTPPDEVIPIPFQTGVVPGYRVAVFDEGSIPPGSGVTAPQTPLGFATMISPGVYEFTPTTPLVDGSHFISARVQMIDPANPTQTGFGPRSVSLEIVVDTVAPLTYFGTGSNNFNGLDAGDDSGVPYLGATLTDRVTNDTTPTFYGTAEANAVIRVFATVTNTQSPLFGRNVLIGQTVATPIDGTNQFPGGRWVVESNLNMNDPLFFAPLDGTRTILVSGEDLAGNVSTVSTMFIFIDTRGPQVIDIQITGDPDYNLFGLKPDNLPEGPTPLINSLDILFVDLPNRDAINFPGHVALATNMVPPLGAMNPGNYEVRGDLVGIVAISQVIVVNNPVVNGQPATATVTLVFAEPLPDDRYTITVRDSITDPAGNNLDGESNASQPLGNPTFPSGDGQTGGDFMGRFTVDSRPEVGVWGNGKTFIDLNGNGYWDPQGSGDAVHHDNSFKFGRYTDDVFEGNFAGRNAATANGYDKLGAYGKINGVYRWLLDLDGDGLADFNQVSTLQINGMPIAGNFTNAHPGDEIGLFTGSFWYLDTNGNNNIDGGDTVFANSLSGFPIVGDFDGDGLDDLATYRPDDTFGGGLFSFDLRFNGFGQLDQTIQFGFPGVMERPVAADMDRDGIDDIGLFVPRTVNPDEPTAADWYFLVSQGPQRTGQVNTLNHAFDQVPFSDDLFYTIFNGYHVPIVGNFDPPIPAGATASVFKGTAGSFTDVVVEAQVDAITTGGQAGLVARRSGGGNTEYWGGVTRNGFTFTAEIRKKVGGNWTTLATAPVSFNSGDTIRFEVVGTSLKLSVAGAVVATASDASIRDAGGVGSDSSPSSVVWPATATAVVRPATALPYSNGFDQANGATLGGEWNQLQGGFTVNNGVLAGQGKKNLATLFGVVRQNVIVEANVTALAKNSYAALVARYNEQTGEMYYAQLINKKGKYFAEIIKVSRGVKTKLSSTRLAAGITGGRLSFTLTGVQLSLTLDGVSVGAAADTGLLGGGGVGLLGSAGATFDDVTVIGGF